MAVFNFMYLLPFVVGTSLAIPEGLIYVIENRHDITCEPHKVYFSERSGIRVRLNVELRTVNSPKSDQIDYQIMAYYKQGNKYIQKNLMQMGPKYTQTFWIDDVLSYKWDGVYIGYCIYNNKKINYSDCINTDRIAYVKCTLTLNWKNHCKRNQSAGFSTSSLNTDNCLLPLHRGPCRAPQKRWYYNNSSNRCENFIYGGCQGNLNNFESQEECEGLCSTELYQDVPHLRVTTPLDTGMGELPNKISIKCSVRGKKFDLLSLYQKHNGERILLKRVQNLNDWDSKTTLQLEKTLFTSDQGSAIYCSKASYNFMQRGYNSGFKVLPVGDFGFQPLAYHEVSVLPDGDTAWFEDARPLSFVCKGTSFLDGRDLTWYIQDLNSSKTEVPQQKSDRARNENRLTLLLNKSYHQKTLFCALDYHLRVEYPNETFTIQRYGVLASSKKITLKTVKDIDDAAVDGDVKGTAYDTQHTLMKKTVSVKEDHYTTVPWWVPVVVLCASLALVVPLVVITLRCRRKVKQLEAKREAEEALRSRAPCPPPEDLTYEQVYAHGAGLARPRRSVHAPTTS